ncbi:MAG: MATE family efflux transporter [Spirochaetales bacterium]|nr:MATE family efflux transporter [Spirochaetales bacterium]
MYQDFTEGAIVKPLLKFAIPIVCSMFLQNLYGAVDLLVVGHFGSPVDVSAVSTGSMLMMTITLLVTGLSLGITIIAGHKIGEKKTKETGEFIAKAIFFLMCIAAALTVLVLVFSRFVVVLMKAPEEAFDGTLSYVRICALGMLAIIGYNLIGAIFRGIGDSKMPLIAVAIASVVNIVGDLILVAVFSLGPSGTAIATIFAQGMSVIISLLIMRKRTLPFTIDRKDISWDWKVNKQILSLGLPSAVHEVLVTVSFLFLISIANSLGVVASAGVGIAEKVCGFVMLIPSAYNQSIATFVAQNEGAQKLDRASRALFSFCIISFLTGILIFYFSFFHGDLLSGIFSEDADVISAGASYLKAYAIDCLFVSFYFCFIGYLVGRGRTVFVMLVGLISAFFVRTPLAYLFSHIEGVTLFGIGLCIPIATAFQTVLAVIYLVRVMKLDRRQSLLNNNSLDRI